MLANASGKRYRWRTRAGFVHDDDVASLSEVCLARSDDSLNFE